MSDLMIGAGLLALGAVCLAVGIFTEPKYRFKGEERKPR